MMSNLVVVARELSEVLVQSRLRQLKTRMFISLVTAGVILVFSLLAMMCLLLLVFMGLTHHYPPEVATAILFGFCIVMCLGALIFHKMAIKAEDRIAQEKRERHGDALSRSASSTLDEVRIGAAVKHYFADNKLYGLLGAAVIGAIVGSRPGDTYRAASRFVRSRR